jgi:transposase-like protein
MRQNHGARINRGTIHRWIQDYSRRLHGFLGLFKPRLRGSIHADEVIVKVKRCHDYSWGAIDRRTRFKISGPLTLTRSYRLGTVPLYEKLRDGCEGLPPRIVSDKLGHYRRAFNKYFYHSGVRMVHGVPIACRKHGLKHNNNPIERENQRIKTRTKTMRGFKSHISCKRFLDMLDITHNFIKPNMALNGSYPAEEANIKLPIRRNRLLSLIQISATPF